MIPYIAALVVLLIAVLFTVYKRIDMYTNSTTSDTTTTSSSTEKKPPTLYDAICGMKAKDVSENEVDVDMTSSKEQAKNEKEAASETSVEAAKEMENRITKNIVSQLKDSLLAERSTHNILDDMSCPYASYSSNAVAQGQEYNEAKPNPGPDMSEYIRKDSIPCWNCSLP